MSSEEDNLMSQDELDSESNEGSDRKAAGAPGLSLTKFLFGNVDKQGRLESDFLDPDTKKQLNSLERLGCSSLISDIVSTDETAAAAGADGKDEDQEPAVASTSSATDHSDEMEKDDDFSQKSPSAVDYFDISEVADDEEALPFKMPTAPLKLNLKGIKRPADEEDDDYDAPMKESAGRSGGQQPQFFSGKASDSMQVDTPSTPSTSGSTGTPSSESGHKHLDTPLAAMLPDKYKDVDVKDIFPEFRKDQVLRFSRLFGAGKPSHLPQPWKNVKFKRNKRKSTDEQQRDGTGDDGPAPDHKGDTSGDESVAADSDQERDLELDMGQTPSPSHVETDDEDVLLKPLELRKYNDADGSEAKDSAPKVADWRFGPAQYWYDFIGVPESGEGFDYGLKQRQQDANGESEEEDFVTESIDPDDAFHLVTQLQWEDDIIWNGDDIKQKVLSKLNEKNHAAGWVPSGLNRTASAFTQQAKGSAPKVTAPVAGPSGITKKGDKNKNDPARSAPSDEMWYSIFPVENEELIYGIWEDDIIWDAESMKKIPEPRVLTLDPNDENIVLGIPDDIDPSTVQKKEPTPIPLKEKKEHHLKKSRILLGKAGVIAEQEPEVAPPPTTIQRDPFNISNDEYYNPKLSTDTALKPNVGGNLIQHSIPSLELRQPFFPTHMGLQKLRFFHRPALKRYSHGTIADTLPHGLLNLVKHVKKKQKQREAERQAAGGGEIFFMRTPEDLSGKDSDIILAEMSEEHPPLVSMVGMATKIKNYFKRKPGKDGGVPEYDFGETAYSQQSPFLGNLTPGQSLQTMENNLYRAPIFRHDVPDTDFLVIRTRNNYFIREVSTIFTVGQLLPLFEVPGPNSKKANNFIRDFLQVFIYRLFYQSKDVPKRIKMEDIKKAFPSHSESSIRKRLKLCADFKRTGMDSNWWVLKPDFRLPTEDEMRAMVSPEQCCAFYSMIAAEQRLKDAGYGEKSLFATAEDDNDEDLQVKMDDEVKAAPWNTTRAFISAMNGKCLLQLAGVADPTGCGEGFSYVRIPNKPTISKEETQKELAKEKKTVTGTDADLRRLPLNQAKNLLRKHGVPEDEIKKLSRWEVIDVVRTLSTEQAKAGTDTMSKFARGNRFSIAEHQERYKEECQRVFDLQNQVLASNEVLSTDEDESEEDSDIEEMAKNMESMLSNKKTSQQLSHEKEEAERRELQKMILGEDSNQGDDKKKKKGDREEDEDNASHISSTGRILKIYRTYVNADKKEYVRIETVRKPAIIDTYTRIRQTKDDEFIRKFATALDDQQKEEKRREKRRIQEQLRRLKRNEEREKTGFGKKTWKEHGHTSVDRSDRSFLDFDECPTRDDDSSPTKSGNTAGLSTPEKKRKSLKEKKQKKVKEITMKCGACGEVGHMKTNRNCPMFTGGDGYVPSMNVAMTEEQEKELECNVEDDGECLVKAEDTKIILSKSVMNQAEEMRRKTLVLKVPKELMKRKKRAGSDHCDYLQKPDYKATNRRRTDPQVSLSLILESLCNEMKELPMSEPFWSPVNAKLVPDYYKIVTKPMDILTMRKKVADKVYKCRADFMTDVDQIVTNSTLYNGLNTVLTATAKRMQDLCVQRFGEKAEKIARIEKAINPLLDDNDHVAFGFMLENITEALRLVPESWPFHKPVDKKKVKDYYDRISNPMDLETVVTLIKHNKYTTVADYMSDIELIHSNSVCYNGPNSQFTKKAEEIVEKAKSLMAENGDRLRELEERIAATKEAALEAADSESVVTGGSVVGDRDEFSRPGSSAAHSYHSDDDEDDSNAYEYEESRLLGRRVDDADSPEDDGNQNSNADASGPAAVGEEEDVDQNYDPEEFLLESFNMAGPATVAAPDPVDDDEAAQPEWQQAEEQIEGMMQVDQQQDEEGLDQRSDQLLDQSVQQPEEEGDDEGLWF